MNRIKWLLPIGLLLCGSLYAATTLIGTGSGPANASDFVQDLNRPALANSKAVVDRHGINALNEIRWPGETLRGKDLVAGQSATTGSLLTAVGSPADIDYAAGNLNLAAPVTDWATQIPSGGDQTTPRTLVLSWLFNDDLNRMRAGAPLQASGSSPKTAGTSPAHPAGGDDLNTPVDSWPLTGNPAAPAEEDTGKDSFVNYPVAPPSPAPVPEPGTFVLLGMGLLGAGIVRKHMKK